MRIICFTATLTMLLFLSVAAIAQPTGGTGKAPPNGTTPVFNKVKFEAAIDEVIGSKVKGYQAILIKDGDVISEKFDGDARNTADGHMSVTANTQFDIGSVQKFITGTTFLHLMVKKSPWSPSKDKTLQQGLDTPIYTLFPKVWLDGIGQPEIRDIKIRHMLQHRTGFDMEYAGDRTVLGYLKGGMIPGNLGSWEYANINFVLAGYLLPFYEKGQLIADLNTETASMRTTQADNYIREKLGNRMDEIFHERIFDKITPKIKTSCDAKADMKDTAAYGYNSRTDSVKGKLDSQIDASGHCVGQGGYYMSARNLANYVNHLFATDQLLNNEARIAMNKDGDNVKDSLVWPRWNKDSWIEKTYGMKNILWTAGVPPRTHHRSLIMRLPQNYYLIILANSPDLGDEMVLEGIIAFKRGMGVPASETVLTTK